MPLVVPLVEEMADDEQPMIEEADDEPEKAKSEPEDEFMDPAGDSDDEEFGGLTATEAVEKAAGLKAEGNESFKAQKNSEAHDAYLRGLKCLKAHEAAEGGAALLASLNLNSAAVELRLELWSAAVESAAKALEHGADAGKARFRRGVALHRLGRLDESKEDLTAVCRADPKNRDARTELVAVSAVLTERKAAERKGFSGLFGAGKGLYHDEEIKARQRKVRVRVRDRVSGRVRVYS